MRVLLNKISSFRIGTKLARRLIVIFAVVFMLFLSEWVHANIFIDDQRTESNTSVTFFNSNVEDFFGSFYQGESDFIFNSINDYRIIAQAPSLERSPELDALARVRVAELTINFSHQRLDGSDLATVQHIDGLNNYASAIAAGHTEPPLVIAGWRSLDYQVVNMENPEFNHVGIAVLEHNNRYYWYVVYGQIC